MKLLILGGTAWLGHHTALAAIAAGHNVTCAARGNSGNAPAGSRFLQTDRDSGNGLDAAAARSWDAVIDVSRQPGQVRRAVRDLAPSAAFYVFVSTGNVYASQQAPDQDEDAALLPPLEADVMESMEDYGPAKVACEAAVTAGFGPDRRAIVRSGLIGGPGDASGRSGYWPLRFAHPGGDGVLVPDAGERPTQLIDVRDLARWLVCLAAEGTAGIFNATGATVPLREHLETAAGISSAAGSGEPAMVPAPEEWLRGQGVNEWSGPRSLPLWLADPEWQGMNARSNARARAAGLQLRPLARTLADTLAWEETAGAGRPRGAGLTVDEERTLLARLAEAQPAARQEGSHPPGIPA